MQRFLACMLMLLGSLADSLEPRLSEERLVLQTEWGNLELAFFPEVAPKTMEHILKLGRLGAYNSNNFFRLEPGFVAQARSNCLCPGTGAILDSLLPPHGGRWKKWRRAGQFRCTKFKKMRRE